MIVESLLIPILNNVPSKLLDNGVEQISSSHEVDVLWAISRSKIPGELLLNLEAGKLLCAKSKFLASLEECKFKVLQDILEGKLLLDYLLNHARLNDSVKQCQAKLNQSKLRIKTFLNGQIPFQLRLLQQLDCGIDGGFSRSEWFIMIQAQEFPRIYDF